MVQAHSCAPDVAPATLQAKHCAELGVETLTDLEVRGIFFPSKFNANSRNNPRGIFLCLPLPCGIQTSTPGILWALNPIFVAVFNYYPKVLESRGESVSAVFFSSTFPIGQQMGPSLNNLNVLTLIPWICPFITKLCPVPAV